MFTSLRDGGSSNSIDGGARGSQLFHEQQHVQRAITGLAISRLHSHDFDLLACFLVSSSAIPLQHVGSRWGVVYLRWEKGKEGEGRVGGGGWSKYENVVEGIIPYMSHDMERVCTIFAVSEMCFHIHTLAGPRGM